MAKERKLCPRCHGHGSGPFLKPVWNQRRKRIYHYWYFAHREKNKTSWCYIGKGSKEREEEREEEEPEEDRVAMDEFCCTMCYRPARYMHRTGTDARCRVHVPRMGKEVDTQVWRRMR